MWSEVLLIVRSVRLLRKELIESTGFKWALSVGVWDVPKQIFMATSVQVFTPTYHQFCNGSTTNSEERNKVGWSKMTLCKTHGKTLYVLYVICEFWLLSDYRAIPLLQHAVLRLRMVKAGAANSEFFSQQCRSGKNENTRDLSRSWKNMRL